MARIYSGRFQTETQTEALGVRDGAPVSTASGLGPFSGGLQAKRNTRCTSGHDPVVQCTNDWKGAMNDTADSEATEETREAPASSTGLVQIAANGRAKCRACGQALEKGKPRCGEKTANPFGEGTTVYWFHLRCAAERRPRVLLQGLADNPLPPDTLSPDELSRLQTVAGFGEAHHRAERFAKVSVAPSGRARCRSCKELIEKDSTRIELSIFHDGRFDPMGYLHVRCVTTYTEARVPWLRLEHSCEELSPEQQELVRSECA